MNILSDVKIARLKLAQEQAESAIKKTNEKIGDLGTYTSKIYDELNTIQKLFDDIRNVPSEKRLEYEKLKKIRLNNVFLHGLLFHVAVVPLGTSHTIWFCLKVRLIYLRFVVQHYEDLKF